MNPALDAFLRSWPFDGWLVVALAVTTAIYFVGWLQLRRRSPSRWNGGRLSAFLGGLAALFLALGSPIEPFSSLLLSVHMVQHLLLIMVAPPLILAGRSFFSLLARNPPARAPRLDRADPADEKFGRWPFSHADKPAGRAADLRGHHLVLARSASL